MKSSGKHAILLVNTGTPAEPTPKAVRSYLSTFLFNPRIAPMSRIVWWFILHLAILPKRGVASAEKYRQIWTDQGSPLALAHQALERAVAEELLYRGHNVVVRQAMSFGEPRTSQVIRELRKMGCSMFTVLPLYPQGAFSTTGVVEDDVKGSLRRRSLRENTAFIPDYHIHPTYIRAVAASIKHAGFDPDGDDRLLFSYHSIPLSDIENGDAYELQTGATSLSIANELGLARERWTIGYQCRFDKGRDWLAPFSKDVLARWAEVGGGRVFVVCPNFAVDCLETLYDIERVQKPAYLDLLRDAGHPVHEDSFVYVPCLGATKAHVRVLCDVLEDYL